MYGQYCGAHKSFNKIERETFLLCSCGDINVNDINIKLWRFKGLSLTIKLSFVEKMDVSTVKSFNCQCPKNIFQNPFLDDLIENIGVQYL